MKIRIKGNSVRFRLNKKDVSELVHSGYLEEQTIFPQARFSYALQKDEDEEVMNASFTGEKITVYIPAEKLSGWDENDLIGFDTNQQVTATDTLYILIEKDFVCLDDTTEDQSDNYENPNKTC